MEEKEINPNWLNKKIKNEDVCDKYTIFGEENFIDKHMITIVRQIDNYVFDYVFDEVYKAAQKIIVNVDKIKLEKWLNLCVKLDNIDETDLIDFATKKRFSYLKAKSEQLKKENEELKSAQNKIAIEKLEDVKYIIFDTPLDKKFYNYNPEKKSDAIFEEINTKLDTMLAELKGEKDEH